MKCRRVLIDFPLALRATLAPLGGYFRPDGWWAPMRTPDGPATLHLRRTDNAVEAVGYGPGMGRALESVPGLIGIDDHPEEFRTKHPIVGELHRRNPGLRIGRTGRVFDALLVAIVAQKVTGKEAGRGLRQLTRSYSEPAPGPMSLQLPPDPEQLAEAAYFDLHPLGIERRRADTIHRVASDAVRIERLADVGAEDACAYLERIRGVGVWTSAETVVVSHGHSDALSVGDFHHKNEVAWHLTGRPRGTDEEMVELLEEFRPHRARVMRLLATLGHAPAFGPRMPIRSIAEI
ncbi:MAG TPA: DNA-3-methyladenine glycosylase 2 family protein [Acidimicrobiia bacterium]|nr:DNA-3-methyladenine glycosylase 2 family protein [Acidimicrobiia bacterium]